MKNLLNWIASKFIGTNIGHKFPFLIPLYFSMRKLFGSNNSIEEILLFDGQTRINVDTNSLLGLELTLRQKFEAEDTDKFLSLLKDNDVFVDVGTNIGYFTLLASKLIGDKGVIISVEPDPYNLKILDSNIKLNNFSNIKIFDGAAGQHTTTAKLFAPNDHAQTEIDFSKEGEIKVDTLSNITTTLGVEQNIKLLKVDVEGAEKEVLLGGSELLANKKIENIMIEINEKKLNQNGIALEEIFVMLNKYFDLSLANGDHIDSVLELSAVLKGRDYVNLWGLVRK